MTLADTRLAFGMLLKRHRLSAGLTHESLAERAGLSPRTISDLERGVSRRPHRDTLELLVQALDLSTAERAALESSAWAAAIGPADLTTSGRDAGSVPIHLTSFVGREEELRATRDRLRQSGARLLTLTGAGGSGKSRLAARVARDLLDEFRDGARYVELAPVAHTDGVLPAIARALGVARPDAATVRLADTIEAICDRQQLLVVDNFEHLLASAPVISALLQGCPGLVIIVTSRASLQLSGEHEMTVVPLAVPWMQLAAAEVVCGSNSARAGPPAETASEVFDGLASLLDNSLVYVHEGPDVEQRFMLLETVREFGLGQLRAEGELETVARAHARYYLALIETTGALLFPGAPTQRRSAAEQHNLHDALRWLLHHG